MKRPIGVSLLAVAFGALASLWLYCGVVGIITEFDDPLHQISGLLFLVLAFMCAALGVGLWNLDEDARRVANVFFLLPSTFGIVGGTISALYESPPFWDVALVMTFLLLIGAPAAYLMRPRIKGAFDQLVVVRFLD